jgi:hypothetical protein
MEGVDNIGRSVGFGISGGVGKKVAVASDVFVGAEILEAVGSSELDGSVVKTGPSFWELQAPRITTNKTIIISHTIFFLIMSYQESICLNSKSTNSA